MPIHYTQHIVSLYVLIIVGILIIPFQSLAQNNCMDIPEIGGSTCIGCAPSGWDVWLLTPDIVNGSNWLACALNGVGTSPSGGNMIILDGSPSNVEGVSTEITGLIPGTTYNIGFYWTEAIAQCGLLSYGGGSLSVTVGTSNYTFSGADDWQLAEICYTTPTSTLEIFLTIETSSPGLIVIDSGICEEYETCCNLTLIAETEYELCPGVPMVFEADYWEETGNVTVEWISDPDSGLDLIDDRFSLNPNFLFPATTDFEGDQYIYTLAVTDDVCTRESEVIVTVLPSEIPDFDVRICDQFEDFQLPTTSDDGYTGVWQGNFDFENLGGSIEEYLFILDPNQNNCIEKATYFFEIEASPASTFILPVDYCQIDPKEFDLPLVSEEGFVGIWDFNLISPENLTPDFYTFNFYPDLEINCAEDYEYEFEISLPDSLTFQIPNSFCISQSDFLLPNVSLEGIQGRWNTDYIEISEVGTQEIVLFTPEDIADCYFEYEHQYTITENLESSFNVPDSICRGTEYYEFPNISIEGYAGLWTPPRIAFDTIQVESISSTWTPFPGQSDCLIETQLEIIIEAEDSLSFSLQESYCKSSGLVYLNGFNNPDNIPGNWSIDSIDTESLAAGSYQYEFYPLDEYCFVSYSYSFDILPLEYPSFNLPTELCASEDALILPTISDNGYSGNWTIPSIDPSSTSQGVITSTFIPTAGQELCLQNIDLSFLVDIKIDPVFDLPQSICSTNGPFTFPVNSLNNVGGSWTIPFVDFMIINDLQISNTFIPNDLECYNEITVNLELIRLDLIELNLNQASDCNSNDGEIILNFPDPNFEYSIDDQLSWNQNQLISNLEAGDYTILIRSTIEPSCSISFPITIIEPPIPLIEQIIITDINDCDVSNGIIEIISNENNLEFSIDDGDNWQVGNLFENLDADNYMVQIRNIASPNCIFYDTVTISAFPLTEILDIQILNVSDCTLSDGEINIDALGIDLEYSIDNGLTWQSLSSFANLSNGIYQVLVRSSIALNCLAAEEALITRLEFPLIQMVEVINPSDCKQDDGIIMVYAEGLNLEYSINGGTNWQSSSNFTNLAEGNYNIVVREQGTILCQSEINAILTDPEIPVIEDIQLINPGTCFLESGEINITSTSVYELEYSIDGGISFVKSGEFSGLSSGEYQVIIRPVDFVACQIDTVVSLGLDKETISIIDYTITQPSDCISDDGSLDINVDIPNCEYSIDGGFNWQTSGFFDQLTESSYTIDIRRLLTNDCSTQFEFSITYPPCPCGNIEVETTVNHISCASESSGSIELSNITGLLLPNSYSIQWSTGVEDQNSIQNLNSGWYDFTIQYDKNCSYEESVFIEPHNPIGFELTFNNLTCTDEGSIAVINYSGGTGDLEFSIDGVSFNSNPSFENLSPDNYDVFVMDQMGCMKSKTVSIRSELELDLFISPFESTLINETILIEPEVYPELIDSFEWSPNNGIQNPNSINAIFSPDETTIYSLSVYLGQCVETRDIEIEVVDNRDIYLGNIFSPNRDGNNDDLFIQTAEELDVEIQSFDIFDRWGNNVFSSINSEINNPSIGWDGYFNNRKAEIGVYTYVISYLLRGNKQVKHGQVSLIR